MTSRERVACVLRGEKPDKLPNGWGGCETAGMHVLVHERLKEMFGFGDMPTRVDTFMFNAVVNERMLTAIHGDIMLIASPLMCSKPLYGPDSDWRAFDLFGKQIFMTRDHDISVDEKGYTNLSINGRVYARSPKGGYYFDSPADDMFSMQEMPAPASLSYRRQTNDDKLRLLEDTAKSLYQQTSFALNCGEAICDLQLMPGGMVAWYDAMINEPDLVHEYLDRAVDAGIEDLKAVHQAVGKYACMLSIAHDLGDRRGVTIGPALFRSIYLPHYRRLFKAWHEITGMKVNLHSCGSVVDILGDLIDAGVDVYNPVQISCRGMEPEVLSAKYGKQVVFYGGAYDAVNTPPTAPAEEVYRTVCDNITALSKEGGYIFAGVHNMPADTPPANIQAILQAFLDTR